MLRRASSNDTLMLDGEPLTSERLKAEVERVFTEHCAYADEFHRRARRADDGRPRRRSRADPARASRSSSIFSRGDRETGVYTDMTRTYVVGEVPDELREYHRSARRRSTESSLQ